MKDTALLTELLGEVYKYKMPENGKQALLDNPPLVLCGVSASGKNSLANALIKQAAFERIVTYTTRQPRQNDAAMEEQGTDYWFVTNEQMLELIRAKAMLEVQAIHGQTVYGTSIKSIIDIAERGKRSIWQPDIQGALLAAKVVPRLEPIFLLPPSFDIWMERLGSRGYMSDGEKERRMHSAREELEGSLRGRLFRFMINADAAESARDILNSSFSSSEQHALRQQAQELLDYIDTV